MSLLPGRPSVVASPPSGTPPAGEHAAADVAAAGLHQLGPSSLSVAWSRAWVPLLFAVLALAFVGPALLPGRALLPIDNLFQFPPWSAYAADFGVGVPHNGLISDAILQNYSWKLLARESLARGELPLWNPYILGGQPFMAAGQNGALYPLGIVFYVLPLAQAYGWFIALHLWLGACFASCFARTLGATRYGGIIAGITFGFCGYLVVSFLWPMVVSTAIWLPALLAPIELLIARPGASSRADTPLPAHVERSRVDAAASSRAEGRRVDTSYPVSAERSQRDAAPPVPRPGSRFATSAPLLVAAGALVVGLQFLAGHLEMSLYLLLTAGLYTALRLLTTLRTASVWRVIGDGLSALGMVALGTGLAAILLVPFSEVIGANVRSGWSDYSETVGYALPRERAIGWLMPDFFGNPTHHSYRDVLDGEPRSVEHRRPNGELRTDTEWGGKNYVEGTAYVGILPLLLAMVALLRRPRGGGAALVLIALISVLLAFGTPLYAVLFYGISGVNQLHTPFRWVYPLSLCIAVLAGLGASRLATRTLPASRAPGRERAPIAVGLLGVGIGLLGLLAVVTALAFPERALDLAARALQRWSSLRQGFDDPRVLFSYQLGNVARATLLLLSGGTLLLLGGRRRSKAVGAAAVALLVTDLFTFGAGFNSAADARPLALVPRSIEAIRADSGLFRVATLGEDDTLPANTNMLFGLQDIRGYDTIILRDYVEFLELIEPQRGIPYSKVAKLFEERSLDSPLLHLLNVKYVMTSRAVSRPGWSQTYEGEGIHVYRNERALPRAFVVTDLRTVVDRRAALEAVGGPSFDPSTTVVLEPGTATVPAAPTGAASGSRGDASPVTPARTGPANSPVGSAGPSPLPARVEEYGNNRVVVSANAPNGGVLVLGDVYFPGWRATVDGDARPLLRANAILRGVELEPGEHTVVFEYRPLSVRLGAVVSGLSALCLALLAGWALLRPRVPRAEAAGGLHRLVRNSAFPMAASLLNKGIDMAFALVMFRILQAEGVGAYTFAGVLVGYLDTFVGFGLGTLITREVARDHSLAGRYLGSTLVPRLGLWFVAAGLTAVLTGPLAGPLGIGAPLAVALWLLVAGLLPGIVSGTISALFMAHERMTHPAAVTVLTTLVKVALGLAALLAGWGYVGLAGVSVVTNAATMLVLLGLYARTLGLPRPLVDLHFGVDALRAAFPLMLNGFLNALFFKVDVILLKPLAGDVALGWYSTAYKVIDGLQVIPASFVLAVFPLLSRHAGRDLARLAQVVTTSLKVLLVLAFPLAVGTSILADSIVSVFAGASFLPQSATALEILIWYLPLSFINGLAQYVLIAIGRTRAITVGFAIGLGFNLAANALLIPRFGYLGAAGVTVASELVLLVPFWTQVRRELPSLSLPAVAWRPAVAALVMAGPVWLVNTWSPLAAIPAGAAVYAAVLLALDTFDRAERRAVLALIHRRSTDAISDTGATCASE